MESLQVSLKPSQLQDDLVVVLKAAFPATYEDSSDMWHFEQISGGITNILCKASHKENRHVRCTLRMYRSQEQIPLLTPCLAGCWRLLAVRRPPPPCQHLCSHMLPCSPALLPLPLLLVI